MRAWRPAGIGAFLKDAGAVGAYAKSHIKSTVDALAFCCPDQLPRWLIESIISGNVTRIPGVCANLLALASMSRLTLVPVAAAH